MWIGGTEVNTAQTLSEAQLALDASSLLGRCRAGDAEAMRQVIAKNRVRLVRVAANVLRDTNEAEDVAQDAFLKAFREIHRVREDSAFSGYLYRICVRLCMDRLRSRRAVTAEFDASCNRTGTVVETKVLVENLLDTLSPDLRATLVLREMEQLSYDEIAEMTGVPVGTVRSRLHVARERFRAAYVASMGEKA